MRNVILILCFAGKTLEDQGVTHNAKVMVLQLEQSDEETKRKVHEEELQRKKEKDISEKMQRTKKGLEILAERGRAGWCGSGELGILQIISVAFQHAECLHCHFSLYSCSFLPT